LREPGAVGGRKQKKKEEGRNRGKKGWTAGWGGGGASGKRDRVSGDSKGKGRG